MKYHGFFLVCSIVIVLIVAAAYWIKWWQWNAYMADKKAKSRSLGRGYDSKNEYELRRVYHNGF